MGGSAQAGGMRYSTNHGIMRLAMAHTDDLQTDAALPPLEGGWIALPLVAVLGGAWAYSRTYVIGAPAQMALAAALVIGGWQVLWHALARTDWATPLWQWKGWTASLPVPALPYQQPDAPGAALRQRVGQARAWWQAVGRAALRTPLQRAAVAVLVSVLLGLALGRLALLLTLCFLALTELVVLWHEGDGEVGSVWAGIALVGLPWFLGATLAEGDMGLPVVTAAAIALLAGLYAQRSWWAVTGPVLAGGAA